MGIGASVERRGAQPLTGRLGRVSEMPLPQKKRWESMAKGLVLGALFTSFLLLLYSYAVPPLYTGLAST
ncbi:GAL3ST1 [Cervus elaphus hippelaphus]|uniref:GAL3ST1 n=1 Tax=Cervus elaphus hippelaphus TaxID=46360 RepID=A0A212D8G0_CEREH|nr:GAL3ST1 [Cervus elaphus hippelaphus]